jgi:hypothetical protein
LRRIHNTIRTLVGRFELHADYERVLVVAPASTLPSLLDSLVQVQQMLTNDEAAQGLAVSVGVARGPLALMNVASGKDVPIGEARSDADLLADHAAPSAIFVAGDIRNALVHGQLDFPDGRQLPVGRRRTLRLTNRDRGVPAYEVLWSHRELGLRRQSRTRRRRAVINDWHRVGDQGFLLTDDGEQYFTFRRFVATPGDLDIGQPVYFIAKPPLRAGDRPLAAAVLGVNSEAVGEVVGAGPNGPFVRVNDEEGNYLDLRGDETSDAILTVGDRVVFQVAEDAGEPIAEHIRRTLDRTSVTDRFLAATMDELRRHQAGGAAQAVRRATRSREQQINPDPRTEWQRCFKLCDIASRDWVPAALEGALGEGHVAGWRSLGPVHDPDSALEHEHWLAEQKQYDRDWATPWGETVKPVVDQVQLALRNAARLPQFPDELHLNSDNNPVALVGEHAGRALAQALKTGVIGAIPVEAKKVVAELDAIR